MRSSHLHASYKQKRKQSVLDYVFKDVCIENSFGKKKKIALEDRTVSLSEAKTRFIFTVQYSKDNDSVQGKGQAGLLRGQCKIFSSPVLVFCIPFL